MIRRKAENIRDVLKSFWDENPELYHKMLEARVERLWRELNPVYDRYTTNAIVKNRILYVSVASSVLRSEMLSNRKGLVRILNDKAGSSVIDDIMIR